MSNREAVSVIICTRNRAADLRRTLVAIALTEMPSDIPVEILVMDNGSTDATADVVQESSRQGMPVRRSFESHVGKSISLNRALSDATGTIILTTDDDVRPPANWISGMVRPILDGAADAIAGGVIFPDSHKKMMNARVPRHYWPWFASTETIDEQNPERAVGANMAFHRRVLSSVSGFDPRLGPGALGFGEETLFSSQLLDAGFRLGTRLDVRVEHHFDLSRLTRHHMLLIAERMGRSEAYLSYHWRRATRDSNWFKDYRFAAGLWRRRFQRPSEYFRGEIPAEWELSRVTDLAFIKQFKIESQGERRYRQREDRGVSLVMQGPVKNGSPSHCKDC